MTLLRDDQRSDEASDPLRRSDNWGEPISTIYRTGPAVLVDYRADVSVLWQAVLREQPAILTTFPSLLAALMQQSLTDARKPRTDQSATNYFQIASIVAAFVTSLSNGNS